MQDETNLDSMAKYRVLSLYSVSSDHGFQSQVKFLCNLIHLLTHSFTKTYQITIRHLQGVFVEMCNEGHVSKFTTS